MGLSAGTRLGPYEIESALGVGGMGEVYRARDTRLDRTVAIKVLPQSFADDTERLHRFEQETRILSALNHPNLLVIYDVGTEGAVRYFVSEFLEGETLRDRMTAGALPQRRVLDIGLQIANGLAAAHAKGIVHRDLKPENVFLTPDGRVKILDFGLAKNTQVASAAAVGATLTSPGTAAGFVLGTIGYMSPEQVRAQPVDHRSDIFSLGAILYEAVSGKRAFEGESSVERMNAILKQEPPELSDTDLHVSPGVQRIMLRCLEKAPERRFQSASDLAFALDTISSASSTSGVAKAPTSRRRFWWAASAASAVTAALLIAGWAIQHNQRPALPEFHRITFRRGFIQYALFSNDDKTVIYSASWDGRPHDVFSTQESSPESRSLGIRDAMPISVSSKGELALILSPIHRWAETAGTLATVAVGGGAPREIADGVFLADWSPDGTQLATTRGTPTGQEIEYPIGKKIFETSGYVQALKVSPKGDSIAIIDDLETGDNVGYVKLIDTSGRIRATSRLSWYVEALAWKPDASEVWFTGSDHGLSVQLRAMDLNGRERLIANLPGNFWICDIAADGRVLMGQTFSSASLFVHRRGSSGEQDLYWHDQSAVVDLSSDGGRILFTEGGDAIDYEPDVLTFVRDSDGSPAVRLGRGGASTFSPDGKWAMVNPNQQPAQLVALPLRAGEPRTLTADQIHHLQGRWLPDNKTIVFVGVEAGHRPRYYVQDSPQSAPRPISDEDIVFDRGTDDIVLSPDGRFVAVARKDRGIYLLSTTGGESPREVQGTLGMSPSAVCKDNSLLAYRAGEIPTRIERINLANGKKTIWRELAPSNRTGLWGIQPIRVASDCESYAYTAWYNPSTLFVVSGLK